MLIATWNINGVKARIDALLAWLDECAPDVVGLQEIKSVDDAFPRAELEARGWHVATHGQKGFNGVALLSREPAEAIETRLPGDDADEQARFIEGVWNIGGRRVRIASLYLPNGNPLGTPKFGYKLEWFERLIRHARQRLDEELPLVLMGDYNVIPMPEDCRTPENWSDDALYQPESRAAYRRLLALGFTDAVRATTDAAQTYTFWDYQNGAWPKNNGIRIDHVLLSPEAVDRFESVRIEKHVRSWEKPSDHVPVAVRLRF